ncbi:MAG: tRNA 2-thiouridine(34) synthase MnmA [Bacteroidales bacterium]|nr:tRNA 2-thiouridine(34) synthase MnmA [Bacteroidales bacterium]
MKIAVGLSGGVDSSVAALLLKQQGHDVMALFMRNWHDTTGTLQSECTWEEDLDLAKLVAHKLNIPFHYTDLSRLYKERVVDYMFFEYAKGRTPNPDILCNREIKFDVFLEEALALGADKVATGHYCRIEQTDEGEYKLLKGADPNKDQSYFLCQLNQQQLSKSLFPIGHLTKNEVRELARKNGLPTSDRKDSQGICFVGKVDLPVFLQQHLKPRSGHVVEVFRDGSTQVIGKHNGAHYFTIGQRKGLNIGGHKEPLFVLSTHIESNTVYVGEGQDHPGLYHNSLSMAAEDVHWVRPSMQMQQGEEKSYPVRIRYRQPLQEAMLTYDANTMQICFHEPQRGITPGQFAVWYKDEELLGSGVIESRS